MNPSWNFEKDLSYNISWRYHGGGGNYKVCHPLTDWRQLPFLVIVCPVEGEYLCEIKDSGKLVIRVGEVLLVPSGTPHKVGMPDGGALHCAHVEFTMLHSIDVLHYYKVPFHIDGIFAKKIAALVNKLSRLMQNNQQQSSFDIGCGIEAGKTVFEILYSITRASEKLSSCLGGLQHIARIVPVLNYMEEHIDRKISRSDLAAVASLSPTRFHYVFKDIVGYSPMEHLKKLRMSRAQILLIRGELSVSRIAVQVGYPDLYHFSKLFRSTFGESPLNYRKRMAVCMV